MPTNGRTSFPMIAPPEPRVALSVRTSNEEPLMQSHLPMAFGPSSPMGKSLLVIAALFAIPAGAQRPRPTPAATSGAPVFMVDSAAILALKYRHIGPEGNRVTSVSGVAG